MHVPFRISFFLLGAETTTHTIEQCGDALDFFALKFLQSCSLVSCVASLLVMVIC